MTAEKAVEKSGGGTFKGCNYFNASPWKLKYACFQSDESARCDGCPRTTWIKLIRSEAMEVTIPLLWGGGRYGGDNLGEEEKGPAISDEKYPELAEVDSGEITYDSCGYFEVTPWKMKYACFHRNEFMWCGGCPRAEGLKGFRKRREEVRATGV